MQLPSPELVATIGAAIIVAVIGTVYMASSGNDNYVGSNMTGTHHIRPAAAGGRTRRSKGKKSRDRK
jgi:hypothetical protein